MQRKLFKWKIMHEKKNGKEKMHGIQMEKMQKWKKMHGIQMGKKQT